MDRVVPALDPADGPRTARLARLRRERVVAALAVRAADRMDGRQVDDVEPHGRRALQLALGITERPVTAGHARAREELVPCGEARALAIHHQLVFPLAPRGVGAVEVTFHQRRQRGVLRDADRRRLARRALDARGPRGERGGVLTGGAAGGAAHQRRALLELAGHVLTGIHPLGEVGQPRGKRVGHGLDRVEIARVVGGGERPGPAVVVHEAHRRLAPGRLVRAPILEEGAQHVVAFLEDVGGHLQDHPHLALDGVAPAVHDGLDVLDDDGAPEVLGVEHGFDFD